MTAGVCGGAMGISRFFSLTIVAAFSASPSHAVVSSHSAADEVYMAMAEGDLARADALSSALIQKRTDIESLSVRFDVLERRYELTKPAGDELGKRIAELSPKRAADTKLAQRFELYRLVENGEKDKAIERAQSLLASASSADMSIGTAQLHALVGCAGMIKKESDNVESNIDASLAAWKSQKDLAGRFHEYLLWECRSVADARAGRENASIDANARAAEIAATYFGEDTALRLEADYQRASEFEALGRFHDELELREQSLARARRHYGENHLQTAAAESGLGACLQQLGDYQQSRVHFEAAEKIIEKNPDVPFLTSVRTLVNFANVLQEVGDETGSLTRYRKAYALAEPLKGTERIRSIILSNTGNTEFHMRHFDEAEADFVQALALRESIDGKQAPALSFSLEGLGSVALARRQFQQAFDFFDRALTLRESVAEKDRSQNVQLSTLRFGLAMAKWGLGDSDDAFARARECAERVHNLVSGIASNLSERQSVALREQVPPATALVVTLAAQRKDRASIEAAWKLVMRDRGLIARTEARRMAEARARKDPALDGVWQAWRNASTAVAESWLKSDADDKHIQALRENAELAERHFWERVGSDPDSAHDDVTSVGDLANSLPHDGVMVGIAEGVVPDPAWPLMAGRTQLPEQWFAFRLGADGDLTLVDLGRIDALSAQVRAWYALLSSPNSDVAELGRRGADVTASLLQPLHIRDDSRLFFVPDGELFRVSLAALPMDGKYLIEKGIQVHTLANEADVRLRDTNSRGKIVLAGAPAFGATSGVATRRQMCSRAVDEGFPALPNAERELDALRDVLNKSGAELTLLSGEAATKQNVIAALPGAGIIHLATHGFSLDQTCSVSDGTRAMTLSMNNDSANDPHAFSGLAFSGARVEQNRDPIGVLSADEFASLDLSHAGWVVLSACDSGLGPIGRGEGVFGMRRAIRMAGAQTVVMSLWEVDDASTADLMQALYRARFTAQKDVPASIADAMKTTLAERRAKGMPDHPYYWAAFISEGGWH
jgi:CHAT domain-containing protein/tetratricopeptide (TPR) repeat protein